VRFLKPLSAVALAVIALVGVSRSNAQSSRTSTTHDLAALRSSIDHYRRVTWTFERSAHLARTPTSFLYRRVRSEKYLRWSLHHWELSSRVARRRALASLHERFLVPVPSAPRNLASVQSGIQYNRRLVAVLGRWTARPSENRFLATARGGEAALRFWQERAATVVLTLSQTGPQRLVVDDSLTEAFLCIHRHEGAWDANTGNGYYGGLQMDRSFQQTYGPEFVVKWGTADKWPTWAQVQAARRAYASGRGFGPWPSTARACGLI
jgi:Transglycosylase-like domain